MLNFKSPIKEEKKYNDLKIVEIEPTIKINLRSNKREFSTKIGKILSILPPNEANTSSGNENYNLLWLSPDEWMIYSNEVFDPNNNDYETENLLNQNISKTNLGAVTDVSDQFVLINIKGDKIFDLFETGSPFNFNDFRNKKGSVTQTILAKIDVIIHNQNKNEVNLFVRRSFSQHLFSWMNDSASRL